MLGRSSSQPDHDRRTRAKARLEKAGSRYQEALATLRDHEKNPPPATQDLRATLKVCHRHLQQAQERYDQALAAWTEAKDHHKRHREAAAAEASAWEQLVSAAEDHARIVEESDYGV